MKNNEKMKSQKKIGNKGNSYIDISIFIVIAVLIMYLVINIISVLMVKQKLDDFANELVKTAEISGRIGEEVLRKENKLRSDLGIEPRVVCTPASGNVKLGEDIEVRVSDEVEIGVSSLVKFEVVLVSKKTGQSEVYWK